MKVSRYRLRRVRSERNDSDICAVTQPSRENLNRIDSIIEHIAESPTAPGNSHTEETVSEAESQSKVTEHTLSVADMTFSTDSRPVTQSVRFKN